LTELFGAAKAEMASALSQIEAQINALADANLTESANASRQPSVPAPSAPRHHRGKH
jgi:hypothetical protein